MMNNSKQRSYVYRATKNVRSMHSSERTEEMVCELERYRWDASETWRQDKSEIWETNHKHIFMGAGRYDNKHGVGIMLNKKWRQRIIDTEYINEQAITTTIVFDSQRIKLMSVYFRFFLCIIDAVHLFLKSHACWKVPVNFFELVRLLHLCFCCFVGFPVSLLAFDYS